MDFAKVGEKNFFEEFGLEVAQGDIQIGSTYPIFGMITNVINDTPGEVLVEINFNIQARMKITDAVRIDMLKERAFESGIFVSTIVAKKPAIEVECQTVIYGRRQSFNA